jgi:hypothetical protein
MHRKIIEVFLRRIRSQSEKETTSLTEDLHEPPPINLESVSVREAEFTDFEEVYAMNRRLGQGADSTDNWLRLWRDNPAVQTGKAARRIGWVLMDTRKIVGFLGSIPLLYEFQGRTLIAAATCRFAVEQAYRGLSHLLVNSFFRQKDVDLFLNTTATVGAGKMMTALRASPVPQRDYGRVLFWVLRPTQFAETVLRRASSSRVLSAVMSAPGGLFIRSEAALRRRRPTLSMPGYDVRESGLESVGPEFSRFWEDRAREAPYLFAHRTPEILRWHFNPPGSRKTTKVLSCSNGARLLGYAIARHDPPHAGFRRSLIADLMVESEDRALIMSLISAAHESSARAGSHVLEVLGFPQIIRDVCLQGHPYWRDYPACPYFYKVRKPELQEQLKAEEAWYACPYDGDATIWP